MSVTKNFTSGAFTDQNIANLNTNFADCALLDAASNIFTGTQQWAPSFQACAGSADAVLFPAAINVAIFTSTGPDTATLATPAAADAGKILILVNTNTTQNTCATASNKILNGTATAHATMTAPAQAGAVIVLVASSGFWNVVVGGTGTWVLS